MRGWVPDGCEGKLTVAGIDQDGDGVRDDVQRFIYYLCPDSEQKRLALLQLAASMQDGLLHVEDQAESIEKSRFTLDAMGCVHGTIGKDDYFAVISEISYLMYNTKARILWDIAASVNFEGQVYEGLELGQDPTVLCQF